MGACQTCLFKTCFAPKGTLVGTGIPDDPFSAQVGWDEEKFGEVRTVTLADEAQARSGLERCAKLVRQMKIFDPTLPQPTAVTMRDRKPEIELDTPARRVTWSPRPGARRAASHRGGTARSPSPRTPRTPRRGALRPPAAGDCVEPSDAEPRQGEHPAGLP